MTIGSPATRDIDSTCLRRFCLWAVVVFYTFCLPHVFPVFLALNRKFGTGMTAKIPLVIIVIFAMSYLVLGIRRNTIRRCVFWLVPSAMVTILLIRWQTNPNKLIHIPEYVLMTWILYGALSIDYKGKGIHLLILLCASMLGVIDEILQGIHPARFYGWQDMAVNSVSSFIGILTLMGLMKPSHDDWRWIAFLKKFRVSQAVCFFGTAASVAMTVCLFDIKAGREFNIAYPHWLLACNGLFLAASPPAMIFHWNRLRQATISRKMIPAGADAGQIASHLWIVCPLCILAVMHALTLWIAMTEVNFR
jgi:hypothetical protein